MFPQLLYLNERCVEGALAICCITSITWDEAKSSKNPYMYRNSELFQTKAGQQCENVQTQWTDFQPSLKKSGFFQCFRKKFSSFLFNNTSVLTGSWRLLCSTSFPLESHLWSSFLYVVFCSLSICMYFLPELLEDYGELSSWSSHIHLVNVLRSSNLFDKWIALYNYISKMTESYHLWITEVYKI